MVNTHLILQHEKRFPYITKEAHKALLCHARSAYPEECCGVLVRPLEPTDSPYSLYEPLTNAAPVRLHAFELSPQDLIPIIYRYPASRWEMLLFHSHPNTPATLSEADLEGIRFSSSLFSGFLIVSFEHGLESPQLVMFPLI